MLLPPCCSTSSSTSSSSSFFNGSFSRNEAKRTTDGPAVLFRAIKCEKREISGPAWLGCVAAFGVFKGRCRRRAFTLINAWEEGESGGSNIQGILSGEKRGGRGRKEVGEIWPYQENCRRTLSLTHLFFSLSSRPETPFSSSFFSGL